MLPVAAEALTLQLLTFVHVVDANFGMKEERALFDTLQKGTFCLSFFNFFL